MQHSFLDKVIDEIISDSKTDYSDTTVVFPTRRAALIFRKKFGERFSKPCFLPVAFSINDFIVSIFPTRIAERKELLLELFPLYLKHFPDVTYERYVAWGEMMLNDFNEIDRYLVDAKELFTVIKMSKEIDVAFQFDDEHAEQIKKFWALFSENEPDGLKQKFLKMWNVLPLLYNGFYETLKTKNTTTEGRAYREISTHPEKYLTIDSNRKLIIAGFYALTKAEEIIFDFVQSQNGKLLWDADAYFTDDKMQEAGAFFRNTSFTQNNFKWKENYFKNEKKNFTITGVPLITGQIKHVAASIKKMVDEKTIDINSTVIVLPDEKLLTSLLQSLPDTIPALNVTMGYPFSETLLFRFLQLLQKFRRFTQQNNSITYLHVKTLKELVAHPYANAFLQNDNELHRQINKLSGIVIPINYLKCVENSLAYQLIYGYKNASEIFDWYKFIISTIRNFLDKKEENISYEITGFILNEINELQHLAKDYSGFLDASSTEMLLNDLFDSARIPFSGEPVNGLQVMGFLETRTLDFENVFVINMNEGTLPKVSRHNSFIPFALRKGFGLPTYEEQDSISAYHFWRLLHRAKNISLTYNTQVNDFAGGEKSRYLLQLFYEMHPQLQENISLSHTVLSTPMINLSEINPNIKRTEELTQYIQTIFNSANEKPKAFSATSLHSFINCSLQFYFKYIAQIAEPKETEEEIDAAKFGEIFHLVMYDLYEPHKGKVFDKIIFAEIKNKINEAVIAAIKKLYDEQYNKKGQAYLIEKIITRYVENVIETDEASSGYAPLHFEETYFGKLPLENNFSVSVKGTLDRIDSVNDTTRIVDYKTGNDKVESPKEFQLIFEDTKFKINLQLLMYAWLAKQNNFSQPINAGIYPLRRISSGIEMISDKKNIDNEILNTFENNLSQLIQKIIFTSDFVQTDDLKKCEYCAYKTICNR